MYVFKRKCLWEKTSLLDLLIAKGYRRQSRGYSQSHADTRIAINFQWSNLTQNLYFGLSQCTRSAMSYFNLTCTQLHSIPYVNSVCHFHINGVFIFCFITKIIENNGKNIFRKSLGTETLGFHKKCI